MNLRSFLLLVLVAGSGVLGAVDKKSDLPLLGGTEKYDRVFLWQDGSKIFLTPPWERNVLGGGRVTGDKEPAYLLWGWTIEPPRVRFWTMKVILGKPQKPGVAVAPELIEFARDGFGLEGPDLAAKEGDQLALVYGALSAAPRWELWNSEGKRLSKAWDDGRTYSAVAVSPEGDLALAARTSDGRPFLETKDGAIPAPNGVLGRLSTVGWNAASEPPDWFAVGWGAMDGRALSLLVRWKQDWMAPDQSVPPDPLSAGVLPSFVALTPTGELLVSGREVLSTGESRLWLWDPAGSHFPPAPEGSVVTTFASVDEEAWVLVVHDPDFHWSLVTDKAVTPLAGLDPGDRVTFVSPPAAPAKQ